MNTNRIFLIGLPGSGKTTIAKQLASKLGYPFIDLDALIEKETGHTIAELFAQDGENGFRKIEAKALRNHTINNQPFVMACGGGTPCFEANMEYMNSIGTTIYLAQPIYFVANRLLRDKTQRPLLATVHDEELPKFLEKMLHAREPYYLEARIIGDSLKSIEGALGKLYKPDTIF